MIYIFGDSHGYANFKNLDIENRNNSISAITLHRVGRDGLEFINFKNYNIQENDIVVYQYGEIDCRSHVGKQILLGRDLNEIIETLAEKYIQSIVNNKNQRNIHIIISCVPPARNKESFESIHGEITHEYPFVGTNEERKLYAELLNKTLKDKCLQHGFYFLDYYDYYTDEENMLKYELSDTNVHIKDNVKILELLKQLISTFHIKTIL